MFLIDLGDRFARWCFHASLPTSLLPGIPTTENKNRHFSMEMRRDVPHVVRPSHAVLVKELCDEGASERRNRFAGET